MTITHRASLLAAAALFHGAANADMLSLNYIGQQIVPTSDQFQSTVVGGLSGIDYVPGSNSYVAISDDRSQFNPARYYALDLNIDAFNRSSAPGRAGVTFTGVTTLRNSDGNTFSAFNVDPEAIRQRDGQLFWTSEGERNAGNGSVQNPFVRAAKLDGSYVRDLEVPAYYHPVNANSLNPGIRQNLAFESLTFSNDGMTLYTATENSLGQDSASPATVLGGSPSRILSIDAASGKAGAEYIYQTDAVVAPPVPVTAFATNGLVELLNVPGHDHLLLAIERSFSVGVGNAVRIYLADLSGATDIAGFTDLDDAGAVVPVEKRLLLDLTTLTNDDGSRLVLDNIEGMTWGPATGGYPTLVLVSDNNFTATQFTQFLAFEVRGLSTPATWAMVVPLLAAFGAMRRRRP